MKVIDRWHRRRDGKVKTSYSTFQKAREDNPGKHIYLCPTCHTYHVASKKISKSGKREMKKYGYYQNCGD